LHWSKLAAATTSKVPLVPAAVRQNPSPILLNAWFGVGLGEGLVVGLGVGLGFGLGTLSARLWMLRSLFGEPLGSPTRPSSAMLMIRSVTWTGSKLASLPSTSAATPETCGQAIEVPLRMAPPVSLR